MPVAPRTLAEDPSPPQVVEAPHQGVLVDLGRRAQDVDVDIAPDHGRQRGQLAGLWSEPGEPDLHGRPEPRSRSGRRRPAGAYRLHDEERVALGLRDDAAGLGGVQRAGGEVLGELHRLARVQRSQFDLLDGSLGVQRRQEVAGRVTGLHLLASAGGQDEYARPGGRAQQVVQEPAGLAVDGVDVVHDQERGSCGGREGRGDGVEEPTALLGLGEDDGRRHVRALDEDLGHQPGNLGHPGRVHPDDPGPDRVRPEPGGHDPVGQRPLDGVTPRVGDPRAPPATPCSELLGEPTLPHTRVPVQQDEPDGARPRAELARSSRCATARRASRARPAAPRGGRSETATGPGRRRAGPAAGSRTPPGSPATAPPGARAPALRSTRGTRGRPRCGRPPRRTGASACGTSPRAAGRPAAAVPHAGCPRRTPPPPHNARPARRASRGTAVAAGPGALRATRPRSPRAGRRCTGRPRPAGPTATGCPARREGARSGARRCRSASRAAGAAPGV